MTLGRFSRWTGRWRSWRSWPGKRIPLHATSDGKVLLAYLSQAELAGCLTPPLRRFTDRTITTLDEFSPVLVEVRRRGFATAVEELETGLTAIAVPVRNAEGDVVASISASGPSFRIPADRIPAIAESVRRAAAEVSRRLGWTGSQDLPCVNSSHKLASVFHAASDRASWTRS